MQDATLETTHGPPRPGMAGLPPLLHRSPARSRPARVLRPAAAQGIRRTACRFNTNLIWDLITIRVRHRGRECCAANAQSAAGRGQCGVSIAEFRDSDEAFLAWLAAHPGGYVINIGRGERGYARLHRADCGTITRRPPLTGPISRSARCRSPSLASGQRSGRAPPSAAAAPATLGPEARPERAGRGDRSGGRRGGHGACQSGTRNGGRRRGRGKSTARACSVRCGCGQTGHPVRPADPRHAGRARRAAIRGAVAGGRARADPGRQLRRA